MRTIKKYILALAGSTVFDIPIGARVLFVGMQDDNISVWLEIEDSNETEERCFLVIGTGQQIPQWASYVGSVINKPFVWHVYEKTPATN